MISFENRIISSFLYLIPLSDCIGYGYNLFINLPILKLIIFPTLPILYMQQMLPLGNLIIFLILFLFIARNQRLSYFMRYNGMQVILLKLAIIIFGYLYLLISKLSINFLLSINYLGSIFFIITLAVVIFSIVQCLRGIEPDLPGISSATKMQI